MSQFQEVWAPEVEEILRESLDFTGYFRNLDSMVQINSERGKRSAKCYIPIAGDGPSVVKNPNKWPLDTETREDDLDSFDLDYYATKPTFVSDVEVFALSYDKRNSVLNGHIRNMGERTAKEMLLNVMPTAVNETGIPIVRTSGSTGSGNGPAGSNRKKITEADVASMALAFDRAYVPRNGRFMLIDPQMYYELIGIDKLASREWDANGSIANSTLPKLHTFTLVPNTFVQRYLTGGGIQTLDATPASGDFYAAFAWQQDMVGFAQTDVKIYDTPENAQNHGTSVSVGKFMGSHRLRSTSEGIGAIIQAA